MQKKFNLIMFLLLLSINIFIVYNVYDLSNKSSENQYNKLINSLRSDTTDFTSWINIKKEILNTAKDFVDNFDYDEITAEKTLNPYLNINDDDPDISRIYIGLDSGEFITGGQWIPPDTYDPRTRVWYREAVAADETIISDVYIDLESGYRTATISSPLYINNIFAGVISADVFMNDINDWLTSNIDARDAYTYLLDKDGTVIVHTRRPELVGINLYRDIPRDSSHFPDLAVFLEYFEEVKSTNQIVRMAYVSNGKKIRGIIREIENTDWYISVAAVEDNDIIYFIRSNGNSIIFNTIILGIVIVLLQLVTRIKLELEEKNQRLVIDNERDFLTGIYNRRYFNLYMEKLWKRGKISSGLSLLMLDIDHFKGYNDTYGHINGDEVLKSVTNIINNTIRKQDVFARYGGEEFVLILDQVGEKDAVQIAEKIVGAIYTENIENSSSPMGRISISIGVASLKQGEKIDVRQLTNRADKALYSAKEMGRNTVSVDTETN